MTHESLEDIIIRAIFNKRPRTLQRALLLVFFSVVLLLLDVRGYFVQNVRYYLQAVISPLQYTANIPAMVFHKTLMAFTSQENLLRENQALKTQLILLKIHEQRFLDLENENKQLRALLLVAQELPLKVGVAEVLLAAADTDAGEWVLNKGEHDGVQVGQAVLDASGLLGQVTMVGPSTSRVMLISDAQSGVPVEHLKTGLRSILQGEGVGRPLSLMFIPKTEKMTAGDLLISSGISGRFPKGYPVGKVSEVISRAEDPFLSVSVVPIAQLDRERFVLLVGEENV